MVEQFAKAPGKTPPQVREESLSKSGLRRIGRPQDIAELAVFFASAKGRHIQGTAIAVDGDATSRENSLGWHAQRKRGVQ